MKVFWLATINGEPCGSFNNRRDAIHWLKALLMQELTDLDNQDLDDEYDYNIAIGKIEIKMYEERDPVLGM
jgi:hypothetical protein